MQVSVAEEQAAVAGYCWKEKILEKAGKSTCVTELEKCLREPGRGELADRGESRRVSSCVPVRAVQRFIPVELVNVPIPTVVCAEL